jgi:hypothetical protein
MQKNGRQPIPDFSKKHPQKPNVPLVNDSSAPPAPPNPRVVLPKAKSVKSGRRGQ